jgi:hypothetical protein
MSSPLLASSFLDVAIAQGEAQIEPNRMLDDYRRKAVAVVEDLRHHASLPLDRGYPLIVTKPAIDI